MDRRTFLRGVGGVAVALPFLESLAPRRARAQAAPPRKRFVVFFECNGVDMTRFFPNGPHGALTDEMLRGTALEPLIPYRSKMLVPRGTHMSPMGFGQGPIPTNGCDHKKGMGHKLTAQPLQNTADNYPDGISVDQFIANRVQPVTDAATMSRRPAMTLLVGPQHGGVLGSISYSGAGRPVVGENNPWLAYRDLMRLAGTASMPADDPQVLRRRSVLDLVRSEMDALRAAGLSGADRQKLDMHFTAIRDVETGMSGMTGGGTVSCGLPAALVGEMMALDPARVSEDGQYRAVGRLQMEVMAIALACGYTNVASLQWNRGSGGPLFRWDGMTHQYHHHALSHGTTMDNGGAAVNGYLDMLLAIDRWYATNLKVLLDRLNSYTEAGGRTVLDNSLVVWANELSDGKDHDFRDLPWVMFGSCGGYFKQGQYLKLTRRPESDRRGWDTTLDAPHNRLLTSFIRGMGVDANRFGHASLPDGEYTELRA